MIDPIRYQNILSIHRRCFSRAHFILDHYKGSDIVNVRVYIEPDSDNDLVPTKKGITASVRVLPELIDAFKQAEAEAQEEGLI